MKRWIAILIVLGVLSAGAGYVFRADLRDTWSAWTAPELPQATKFQPQASGTSLSGEQNSLVEGGVATSENFVLLSSPPSASKPLDPLEDAGPLPSQVNLDVPFTSQAPFGNWDLPYQEACEEASLLMVDAFYETRTDNISPQIAKQVIDDMVAYENKTFGDYKHTSAAETAKMAKEFFDYRDVRVISLKNPEQMKRVLANGYPVIIPAAGKLLGNPNFRNGGPIYHMLVVKGYTKDRFITNDPGTRKGADYTYSYTTLMNAIHDWHAEDITKGEPVMLVVMPNPG